MQSKHSRLFYAACGVFSGDLGCIFITFNTASLSFKQIRQISGIRPKLRQSQI